MFTKLLLATLALSTFTAFAAVTKIDVDAQTSKLTYVGKKVTGQHTGEVKLANGFLNFNKGALAGGEMTIDMTSISNSDIQDKEYHQKFMDHIVSEDFFAVSKFNTSKILIKSAKKVKGDNYKVTADLTIKGKTLPVTFDAVATLTNATAKVAFDRTKYDIRYGSGKFFQNLGDKMINDEVELDVNLTLKK